jgi:hypothetical protein
MTTSYEFTDNENATIDTTGSRARTWGIISIVVGGIYTLAGLFFLMKPALIVYLGIGLAQIFVGKSFLGAGKSMRDVVTTKGNDVPLMLQALQKFGKAFQVQIVMALLAVGLGALSVVLGALAAHH